MPRQVAVPTAEPSDALSVHEASDITSLPLPVLEDIASLCTPASTSSARLACRMLRCAFQPRGLRLYTQRPAAEAKLLTAAFPHACRATLMVATTLTACSQEQLDAWLLALQQRTCITDLTLLSPESCFYSEQHPGPPSLAHLASLRHLRSLVLGSHTCSQHCTEAVASLGCLQLTRLEMPMPCSLLDTLAEVFASGGLARLNKLDLSLGRLPWPAQERNWPAILSPLLSAAAASAPHLRTLALRSVKTPVPVMRCVQAALGPLTINNMDVLCASEAEGVKASMGAMPATRGSGTFFLGDLRQSEVWELRSRRSTGGALTATVRAEDQSWPTSDVCTATSLATAKVLQGLGQEHWLSPNTTVDSLALFDVKSGVLDLSSLPATLESLHALAGTTETVRIQGTATALTAASLALAAQWRSPVTALAHGCPNLVSLSLSCKLERGNDWSALALLQHATMLQLNGRERTLDMHHGSWRDDLSLDLAWLPPALIALQLHSIRVSTAGPASNARHCLRHLTLLVLHKCRVPDLRAFQAACSLRRVEVASSVVVAGTKALFGFPELEELLDLPDTTYSIDRDQLGLLAGAAGGVALMGSISSAACGGAALPRLRQLTLNVFDAAFILQSRPQLLDTVSELHLVSKREPFLHEWFPRAAAPKLTGSLPHLATLQVSGESTESFQELQLQLQAQLKSVVVAEAVGGPAVCCGSGALWDSAVPPEPPSDEDEFWS